MPQASVFQSVDRQAIEPRLREILVAKHERRKLGPYRPRDAADIAQGVSALFARSRLEATASNVRRMGGGASKEQFLIDLEGPRFPPGSACVLRMDPREGILETCRRREAQVLRAVAGAVPVPPVLCEDVEGEVLGQSLLVTGFVGGVTKPTSNQSGPSGLGTNLGPRIGGALAPQFIGHLAAIHDVDYEAAGLDDYARPRPGTTDAALWQVNYWRHVREVDGTDTSVLLTLAENWLYERLPVCAQPVLLQGDYRLGNFLFDEEALKITAILDWELAHIGDFHEDLAYSFEPIFGTRNDQGELIVGTMFTTEALLERYQAVSGRTVDPQVLYWYRVLTSYKLIVMNHTSSVLAARDGTNHQNALLAYLSSVTAALSATMCRLLEGELG